MAELILNQFTREEELWRLEDKQITSIFTQSVYSMSNLNPVGSLVSYVERVGNTTFYIEFDNGFRYLVENGKVVYYD